MSRIFRSQEKISCTPRVTQDAWLASPTCQTVRKRRTTKPAKMDWWHDCTSYFFLTTYPAACVMHDVILFQHLFNGSSKNFECGMPFVYMAKKQRNIQGSTQFCL